MATEYVTFFLLKEAESNLTTLIRSMDSEQFRFRSNCEYSMIGAQFIFNKKKYHMLRINELNSRINRAQEHRQLFFLFGLRFYFERLLSFRLCIHLITTRLKLKTYTLSFLLFLLCLPHLYPLFISLSLSHKHAHVLPQLLHRSLLLLLLLFVSFLSGKFNFC